MPPLVYTGQECELPTAKEIVLPWSAGDATLPRLIFDSLTGHRIDENSVGLADTHYDLLCQRRQMPPLNLHQYRCRFHFQNLMLPWTNADDSLAKKLFTAMRNAAAVESRGPKAELKGRGHRSLTCVSAAQGSGMRYSCELRLVAAPQEQTQLRGAASKLQRPQAKQSAEKKL